MLPTRGQTSRVDEPELVRNWTEAEVVQSLWHLRREGQTGPVPNATTPSYLIMCDMTGLVQQDVLPLCYDL